MSATERPFTAETMRQAVWAITDRVKWGLDNEFGHTGDCYVAHDAEEVVLIAATGDYGNQLRLLLTEWGARPERMERPQADREPERS